MSVFNIWSKVQVSMLHIECDLHSHLLPGVDDGRFTLETAADAVARMGQRGVGTLYLTPHVITGLYNNTTDNFSTIFNELQNVCEIIDPKPELHLAAEYMCDDTFLNFVENPSSKLLTLKNGKVLIEMSYFAPSPQIFDIVYQLSIMGYTPVVAHPERYGYWACELDNFDRLKDMGCEFQLNLLSASGAYGKQSMRIVDYLLEKGYYSYVGTDLHSLGQHELILQSKIKKRTADAGELCGLWKIL